MARIPPPAVLSVDSDGNYTVDGDEGADVDADVSAAFDKFRADAAGDSANYMVWIFLVPTDKDGNAARGQRMENLFTAPVDQYTIDQILEQVRTRWMGAAVRWLVRIQIRDGKSAVRFNRLFIVRKAEEEVPHAGAASELSGVLDAVQRMVADSQKRNDEIIERVLQRVTTPPTAPVRDPMEVFMQAQQSTIAMMATMFQASGIGGGAARGDPIGDMVKMMGAMRQLKGFSEDLSPAPAGDGENTTLAIIKAVAPLAGPLLEAMRSGKPQPVPQLAAPVAAPLANPAPSAQSQPAASAKESIFPGVSEVDANKIRDALAQLCDLVAANPDADPKLVYRPCSNSCPRTWMTR